MAVSGGVQECEAPLERWVLVLLYDGDEYEGCLHSPRPNAKTTTTRLCRGGDRDTVSD